MSRTFAIGGVDIKDYKLSCNKAIETLPSPALAFFPLSQHIGAPAVPVVAVGDSVKVGTLIARGESVMSASIHSSVCGVVKKIDAVQSVNGTNVPAIVIESSGDAEEWESEIDRSADVISECALSAEQIVDRIRNAGIVGLGGACFPTHVKLVPPKDCKIDSLIINGVECEPFLTADHRLMLEYSAEIVVGIEILKKALDVNIAYLGIESNKKDAIVLYDRLFSGRKDIKVVKLKKKYPQGGEKQLIDAVLGRRVPNPPALPANVGVVVENVATVYAVYQAVQKNHPLIDRVVTVSGTDVQNPCNLLVRLGTPVSQLIEKAGGVPQDTAKILHGGPMMGKVIQSTDIAVTKGTGGIVMLTVEQSKRKPEMNCVRCAKCVEACPMGLEPYLLARCAKEQNWDYAAECGIMSCIECGCCQSTCPSMRPLLDWVRYTKSKVGAIIRERNNKK